MQRRCHGVRGRVCRGLMSSRDIDPHPFCHECRGQDCGPENTCVSCATWAPPQWARYERRLVLTEPITPTHEISSDDDIELPDEHVAPIPEIFGEPSGDELELLQPSPPSAQPSGWQDFASATSAKFERLFKLFDPATQLRPPEPPPPSHGQ